MRLATDRSTETTRACGCGDRTMRAYSMPGRAISKVYLARPVTLSGPSRRLTLVPRTEGLAGQANSESAGEDAGASRSRRSSKSATLSPFHTGHGFEDASERAATADVAVETLLDLFRRGIGMLFQQTNARHDESRSAEPAHERVLVAEGLLHGMQAVSVSETIHRADLLALHFDR